MAVDFTSILSKPAAEVEKPKPRPLGTYHAVMVGMPEQRSVETKDGERGILRVKAKLQMAGPDVDAEQLADHGSEPSTWPPMVFDFWVDTPEGIYAYTQFLTNTLGIEDDGSKTLGEMSAEIPGKPVMAALKHRPFTRPGATEGEIATDIASFAKA